MKPLVKLIIINIVISLLVSGLVGGTVGLLVSNISFSQSKSLFEKANNQPFEIVKEEKVIEKEKPIYVTEEKEVTASVVKKVSPAVISIVISKELSANITGPIFPFEEFFGFGFPFDKPQPVQPAPSLKKEKREVGGGTGFIISSDGLILTNKHVVADSEAEYTVVTNDNMRYDAKVLAMDPFVDIAMIKIEAKNLPTVTLGDSDKIEIGQTVIAIGNTLSEYRNTVTKGVISGINRRVVASGGLVGTEVIEEAIQTDAAINPGNSGGPLVNLQGEVIGINTAISREGQLIGFAIPVNVTKPIIESVKKFGRIIRPWLGVRYVLVNKELAKENKLPVDYGALILRGQKQTELAVIPGSPADKAGLEENDIILEMDGVKISQDNPLAKLIQKHKPGDKVKLKVLHKGEEKVLEVELAELK